MSAKLKLDLDSLAVQGFATSDAEAGERGTVRAHGRLPCTGLASCPCGTGYWACTTSRQTLESCDYTQLGQHTCLC